MTGRRVWAGGPALLAAVLIATVGVLAQVAGMAGAVSASAAATTYAYDSVAYVYDAPARLSSQSAAASYVRGSPSGPDVASREGSASTHGCCVAANTARAESIVAESRTYVDLTRGGSIRNVGTNATHTEFAETLTQSGWASRVSSDGAVRIFEQHGARYVLRQQAGSYSGWSADFTPAGSAGTTLKLRLGFE